jgi:hypothetical protein
MAASVDVAAGTPHGGRFDVYGMELHVVNSCGKRDTYGAATATEVNHNGAWMNKKGCLPDKELRLTSRNKDSGIDGYTQACERYPADNMFDRKAGNAFADHGRQVDGSLGGRYQYVSLLLGEDAAGGSKLGNDGRLRMTR